MGATLTHEEQARIHAAKTAVEQRTAAEFAVVVVPVSDRYPFVGLVWAASRFRDRRFLCHCRSKLRCGPRAVSPVVEPMCQIPVQPPRAAGAEAATRA